MKIKYLSGITSLIISVCMFTTSCSDDDNDSISTNPIISSVTTGDASVTAASATMTGTVKDLTGQSSAAYKVGVMLASSQDGVKSGTEVDASINDDGTFSVEKSGLEKNKTYYYATFVTLQGKVSYYGDVKSFITTDAKVTTSSATNVAINTATIGGKLDNVSQLPSDAKLTCGVLVSLKSDDASLEAGKNIAFSDVAAAQAGTPFSFNEDGLLPSTKYYYRAYMKLNDGYIMGAVDSLTTGAYETKFVDLGLSVQWAETNVGASKIDEAGGLYAYGDPTGLSMTSTDNFGTADVSGTSKDICMASGTGGRMPSISEVKELISKCSISDSTVNGVSGYRVVGPNGNHIFMPKAGYRNGTTITDAGQAAYLWSGSISSSDSQRGYMLNAGGKKFGTALTYSGLSIRAVKQTLVPFDGSKLVVTTNGDDARIEIYNEYGSTKGNSGIDHSSFMFSKKMYVNFSVFGLGNVSNPITATIGFADGSWGVQDWSTSVKITGDGCYTIPVTATQTAKGIMVFVIDLKGQAAIADKLDAYINSIIVDTDNPSGYPAMNGEVINQDKVLKGDIENKGNYRMEIYNIYGSGTGANPPFDPSVLSFSKRLRVLFELSGMGTLSSACRADLIYADKNWGVSNWGEAAGSVNVTGDGTYSVYLDTNGATAVAPPNVFTVDVNGLANATDISKIKCVIKDIACK
jgi:hypothetical protein